MEITVLYLKISRHHSTTEIAWDIFKILADYRLLYSTNLMTAVVYVYFWLHVIQSFQLGDNCIVFENFTACIVFENFTASIPRLK
jgi:hypothetical protein